MPVDYGDLAKQFGGTIGQKKESPNVDYQSLAKQYGGAVKQQAQPKAPDYAALAQKHGATDTATPQQKIYDATINEGQNPDRASQRVNEYNYAIKQGLNPERAMQFAQSLQWDDASKKVLTEDEIKALADNVRGMSEEDRKKNFIFGDPMEFARGYAEARARGMSQDDAVEYGSSNSAQRAMMRAGQWVGPKWTNFKSSILRTLGASDEGAHVTRKEAAEAPLAATLFGQTRQDYAFNTYRDASWVDKHIGKTAGSIESHLDNLIAGLTTPDMAALEVASFGEAGLSRVLPEVGEEATAATKAARFTQRTIRTTQQLAHAGFTAQMVSGSVESFGSAWNEGKEGNVHEAIGYALDGLVNAGMAAWGVHQTEAHAEVARALDETTGKVYPDKKFSQLSDKQQALMIQKLIDDDPKFKEAQGQSQKEMQKNARRLQNRYSEAVGQAWNPNAAQRTIMALQNERAETARVEQVNKVLDTIKAQVEKRTQELRAQSDEAQSRNEEEVAARRMAELEKREAIQQSAEDIARGRQETWEARQAVGEIPKEAETSRHVDSQVDGSGHVTYPAEYWGETNTFGVGTDGERHSVYRRTPRGVEWLDRSGNFTETPDALYWNADPQASDTLARLSSLKMTADSRASQPEATAEEVKDAETLGEIRRQLVEGEITAREAQKQAGIAEKATLPDIHVAAMEGKLNGPFFDRSADDYRREVEDELRNSGASEEEIQATLESLPDLARTQVEANLNHVYQPGDYIVSKRGVKWTLDSKGLLHPSDGGAAVPLIKRGRYSNQAMQIAASGRVGYGQMTRIERKAEFARNREIKKQLQARQEEFDREMRIAEQNAGLEMLPAESAEVPRTPEEVERRRKFLEPPPGREAAQKEKAKARAAAFPGQVRKYIPSADPNSVINELAKQYGISTDEVMRIGLSERYQTPEGKMASLEVGDTVNDPHRKTHPWKVEEKDGKLYLHSWKNWVPVDRLNPTRDALQILDRSEIEHDRDWSPQEVGKVAFEKAYLVHQRFLIDGVRERMDGKVKDPEPKTQLQAESQAAAAEERHDAAHKQAVEEAVKAVNQPSPEKDETPDSAAKKADEDAGRVKRAVKLAKESKAQVAEAKSKSGPQGTFPQREPFPVVRGAAAVVDQNNRQFPVHYAWVPVNAAITSHYWDGEKLVRTQEKDFPKELQPREPNERTVLQRRIDAQRFAVAEDGTTSGYNVGKLLNKTIDGMSGPPIFEPGLRTVSGNGRLQRLLKHLEVLSHIADVEERDVALESLRGRIGQSANDFGLPPYPDDGVFYIPGRIMDNPISTLEEATKLGLLFNEDEADHISDAQKGLVYGRSLDQEAINKIGRLVEESEGGLDAAMRDNPLYFAEVVNARFDVPVSNKSQWFTKDKAGNDILTPDGEKLFRKALVGYVVQDPDLLVGIEDEVAGRAFEKAIGYMARLKVFPELDITGKIKEALDAARLTSRVNPDMSATRDRWEAVYSPSQISLESMEQELPPEPDRMTEALWRSLNASQVAAPRVFSDRLKRWMAEEDTQRGMFDSTEKSLEKPVDKFNRVFSAELKETALRRNRGTERANTTSGWMLTQNEYDAALRDEPILEEETKPEIQAASETKETPVAETKGIQPPPVSKTAAENQLAEAKTEQGYVTPQQLREFLQTNEATREHASELMRTAQMMAEFVYDADPPVGVERKQALDWVLRERVGSIEEGKLKGKRGEYTDPNLEKGLVTGILKLHKAADATTFIHEFSHIVFPFLSDEDLKAIDTIGKRVWDGNRGTLKGESYAALSEKLAHGMEQFLRDENPTGFTGEVKAVLRKVKDLMRRVYLSFKGDPLSEFHNTEDSREVFARMFGITDFDVADVWRDEVKKARAEEKKIRRPEEEPHPMVKLAREFGGTGVREAIAGKVIDEVGERVDPKKAIAVVTFPSEEAAAAFIASPKVKGGQLIQSNEGTWAVKMNSESKVPKSSLFQSLPERHPGLQLEDLEKRMRETPAFKTFERRLIQMQIDNLRSRIRAEAGTESEPLQRDPELPKKAIEEAKHAKETHGLREGTHGIPRPPQYERTGGIPKPPQLGLPGHAGAGRGRAEARGGAGRAPVSLENVKPVTLQPLSGSRGEPVGTTVGEKFDQTAWTEGLKRAGLPENMPAPTWALDPKTAAQLIYPGQKQIVQMVMSALQEGEGVAVITPPGSGKTYTSTASVKEFLRDHPDARVLMITKNRSLLKKTKRVAANTFGFDVETDAPEGEQPGVYAASYMGLLNNSIYKNSKWDLVVADESGEARRWYDEDTKQGQMLRDVVANSGKAIYMSATPFHSPMEYGYLDKLNLWPKGQFDKWIQENFAHEKVGDKIVARLDPGKQAKLRQQLIERGQFISQAISYDGYTAHFGVVPVTDSMKRGLDRIREGFARARDQFSRQGKPGLAKKVSAFEAVYTKNFLERERLPQAIELAKAARDQGWRVLVFSEHTSDDLFRRERVEGEEPSTYQQLDDAMGGGLSKIIPPYPSIFDELHAMFGGDIGDYSGRGNTDAAREAARTGFLKGETPMLYASYAGGGIGVDMHDADFPELGIKGGDKPIVAIYLGPPYSGVLLEQAMGRPWRFGVKSDVHAVFLATDSEPDIRLMQTKVGPRMKALRAAVLGEKDSLANVMSTYTDEEKVRERQDQLAFSEGNEMKVDATKFQVRSKTRNVGIQDWSLITFPSADEAKNKGMKYGEAVGGGDWSTLYQSKFELRPPDSPEDAAGKRAIDKIGDAVASGRAVPPQLQNLDPADRKNVVGLASATATAEVDLPLDRDKRNAAVQSMTAQMQKPFPYYGLILSQELGMENIARRAGKPEVGKNLKLMNRGYRADYDGLRGQYWNLLQDTFDRNGIKTTDKEALWTITRVLEGHESTANPAYNRIVADLSDMMRLAHQDMSKAGVRVTVAGKKIAYTEFGEDPNYYPHRINWDHEVTDPQTGAKYKLRDTMKKKFDEEIRKRIIASIPELRPYTYQQVYDYLHRHDPRAPVLGHIHRAREVNFPYIRRDFETLVGYFDQVAEATSQANHFGPDNEKLNYEIKKIDDINGINTLQSMFKSTLEPQNWNDVSAKIYNFAIAYEAASKMTFSAFKVPFHLGLVPIGMEGRVMPILKSIVRYATDHREVTENAGYVGVLTRQLSAADIMFGERQAAPVRQILRKELFESAYKMVRTIAGESAKVYLDQYALRDLRKGGKAAEHTRRLLKETFLIGDQAIDEAALSGRFSPDDVGRAQTAFANLTTFSDDPMQMPQLARAEIAKGEGLPFVGLKRAIRLTYALQSFSLKATSLLREKLYDEVVVHKNYKPLAYAIVASPILGQMLQGTGAAAKSGIHRGFEKVTGRKHEKDSWDSYIENLEKTFEKPSAVGLLKFVIDGYTLGYGWDMVRTVCDPFFDLASGQAKKAGKEFTYAVPDILAHIFGSFFDDVFKTAQELARIGQIEAGQRQPNLKPQKVKKSVGKYLEEQVPALRQVPYFEDAMGIKPPPR